MKTSITLHQLELNVHLGWSEAERLQQQAIMLDVLVHFAEPPAACTTDQLNDTYCYDHLINLLKTNIGSRTFRLIEHLSLHIYHVLRHLLPADALINIRITKHPVITQLGGVSFCYGDEKLTW